MDQLARQSADPRTVRLADEPDFALGGIAVRPSLRELDYGNRKEQLEPRVMQVLVVLAGGRGAVVSRDELIERCWDGRIVGEAAINRCIWKLREISEASGEAFRIETIPRVGYRLMPADPDGIARNASTNRKGTGRSRNLVRVAALLATIILVAVALLAYVFLRSRGAPLPHAAKASETSIAVLPFKNLSADRDAGYLAAGLQDEILTRLAKIGSLKVISRTSADQYESSRENLPEIATKLGVATILEGSVQKSGDSVRINVQLIRAATDAHLWAEDYDRKIDDVLQVESDVAGKIASVLAAKVTPAERKELAARPTADPRAYDLYLRALVFAGKNNDDGRSQQTAVQLLDRATRLDPKFALAWAWLARMEAYVHYGDPVAEVRRGAAHAALAKALELDPNLAEAQVARGFYLYYGEQNYPAAERELGRVQARWPNNVEAIEALALIQRRLGKWKESTANFGRLIVLDPLMLEHRVALASNLVIQYNSAAALRVLDDALSVWPDNDELLAQKAIAWQQIGRLDEADAALKNAHPAPDDMETTWAITQQFLYRRQFREGAAFCQGQIATHIGGEQPATGLRQCVGDFLRFAGDIGTADESYQKAISVLQSELKQQPDNGVVLRRLGNAYAGLGDGKTAMNFLDRAVAVFHSSGDAFEGSITESDRAASMARFGDRGAAIRELARLAKLPGGEPPAVLRLDPHYDRLRGDPRFEKLANGGK